MWADFIPLALLTAGVYPLSKDLQISLDEFDLGRMASAFKDMKPPRPAPIVIGHPADDAPSYGIINNLVVIDGTLIGYAEDLSDSFRRGMKEGLYPRYAAQFFGPDNPDNPVPGRFILKHVGFRGPVPPSVRGFLTTDAEFMESLSGPGLTISPEMRLGGPGCVEFAQFGTVPVKGADIALRARAMQSQCAARGHPVSVTQAVTAVVAMHPADKSISI